MILTTIDLNRLERNIIHCLESLQKLKKQLAKVTAERDVLKKNARPVVREDL